MWACHPKVKFSFLEIGVKIKQNEVSEVGHRYLRKRYKISIRF